MLKLSRSLLGSSLAAATLSLAIAAGCGGKVFFEPEGEGAGGAAGSAGGNGGVGGLGGAPSTTTTSPSTTVTTGPETDIADLLDLVPGLDVIEVESSDPAYRSFAGTFEQPVDHSDPNGPKFKQELIISHLAVTQPMVLFNTGYMIFGDWLAEPTLIVNGNQVQVEQRYFDTSIPESANWQLLNIEQAAADHHAIIEALKPIYSQKWLSTGHSKGGMTSLYHRRFYPTDVDGTVAYVAPNSYGLNDARYNTFLDQVGPASCRDAMKAFQIDALSRRDAFAPLIEALPGNYNQFTRQEAFDVTVTGVRFVAWQYYDESICDSVPGPQATEEEIWSFFDTYLPVGGLADDDLVFFEPYYFQAATELGWPGADDDHLVALLVTDENLGPARFVLPGPTKQTTFDPNAMVDIQSWLSTQGSEVLLIYGGADPWSAAALETGNAFDSFRFTAPLANHGASVYDLASAESDVAIDAMLRWTTPAFKIAPAAIAVERARVARMAGSATHPGLRRRLLEELDMLSQ